VTTETVDPRAPMAAAPIRYTADGAVDWGNMWETFCGLAQAGGPPHRGALMTGDERADPCDPAYQAVVAEIIRGVGLVSGLSAAAAAPGWVAVHCINAAQARWLADAICAEHVSARAVDDQLLVPAAATYTVKGEIKSVITVIAKTTHYWLVHLPADARRALETQARLGQLGERLRGWLTRR
jgi:sirohydrochlorin cobaltochelatase